MVKEYIRIKCSSNTRDAEFISSDGRKISGITKCDIRMRRDEICSAQISLYMEGLDIEAEPLLSLENVREAAKHYGYDLIPLQAKQ